jgi:hypothetical protein
MSYVDNTKADLHRMIYILEMENEMLRNQIIKLKIEKNELLDNAIGKRKQDDNESNDKIF